MHRTSLKNGEQHALLNIGRESQMPFLQPLPEAMLRRQPGPAMKTAKRASVSKGLRGNAPGPLPFEVQKVLRPLQVLQDSARRMEHDAWLRSGNASVVNWLVGKLDKDEPIDWDLVNTPDVVAYLKRRLAEFGPLMSKQVWVKFAVSEYTVSGMRECLEKLPLPNRILIVQLLLHLHCLGIKDKQFAIKVLMPESAYENTRVDLCAQVKGAAASLAITLLAPALANDWNLRDPEIHLKAQFMIENAPEICELAQN